jgi:hypothetical protein
MNNNDMADYFEELLDYAFAIDAFGYAATQQALMMQNHPRNPR